MKKFILSASMSVLLIPSISLSMPCVPYNNVIYTIQANGANGTLKKSQSCDKDYLIDSVINASKGWFSKTISQQALGTYAPANIIIPSNYTASNNQTKLTANQLDPLSLVLYLSASLSASMTNFPSINLLYNGNSISVQCSMNKTNISIVTGAGENISATQVTCSTANNSVVLDYSFSQDTAAMMLAASAMENGSQTFSAVINSYS